MRCGGCATCPSDAALPSSITIRRRLGPPEVIHSYPPNRTCSMFGCNARVDSYKVRRRHLRPARCRMAGWNDAVRGKPRYKGNVMESQEQRAADSPNAGDEPNPATQSIDVAEVARGCAPSGAAASKHPPQNSARADETHAGAIQPSCRWSDVSRGVRRRLRRRRVPSRHGPAAAVGERFAVRGGHVRVEYARLLPVCDADRIHGDRSRGCAAGCGRSSAVASGLVCLADCRRCPA